MSHEPTQISLLVMFCIPLLILLAGGIIQMYRCAEDEPETQARTDAERMANEIERGLRGDNNE